MNSKQAAKTSKNLRTSEIWCGEITSVQSFLADMNQ
jgi:hypothetical protein